MFGFDLSGEIAWVTGGSRGIGRAAALALAEAGCHVAISYHKQENEAVAVAGLIEALGKKAMIVQTDVAQAVSVNGSHAQILQNLGAPTILVNAAGCTADDLVLSATEAQWQKVLNINLMGAVHTSKVVLPAMMMRRHGRIIHISSTAAQKGGRGQANYAASKAGVEALTRSLACEVSGRGITVNCVAPGVTLTDMSQEVIKLAREEILSRQLIKRFASAEEIAAAVVFVATAGFMTGQSLVIDGGLKMG